MKVKKILWVFAAMVALVGCRQELAEITYLLNGQEPLIIERGMLPSKQIADSGGVTSSHDYKVGACVQAPSVWGEPTIEVSGTSDDGTPFSETPAVDTFNSDGAQAIFPRADHTWYCYKLAEKTYHEADGGKVTWQFSAGSEPAQVLSTVGAASGLSNLAVHDVARAAKARLGMWRPLSVTLLGDTPAVIDTVEKWSPIGSFQQQALFNRGIGEELLLVAADGSVTVKHLPFEAYLFNLETQAVVISPERLIGFEETGPNELTAQISTDGVNWTAGGTLSLSGVGVPTVAYNLGLGRFVASLSSGKQFYSTDGLSWSEESIAQASQFEWAEKAYASLADGTEAIRGDNLASESVLFVRAVGESDYNEVLPKPVTASADWFVDGVISVGNRFFVETHDEIGPSGEEYTLLTSADAGASWQQLEQVDSETNAPLLAAAKDNLIVVGFNSGIYISKDGGLTFNKIDPSAAMPSLVSVAAVSLERAFVNNGLFFLEINLRDGPNFVTVMLTSEDLDSFTLSASQGYDKNIDGFVLHPVIAGEKVLLVGEDREGFKVYQRVTDVEDTGSKSSGGSVGLFTGLLLLIFGLRRKLH